MLSKNLLLGVIVAVVSVLGAVQASGQEGDCSKLMTRVCNECHNSDRICKSMGGPEEKWQAILDWMISNGAALADDERTLLVDCLTEPYDEAKQACGK